MQRGLLGELLLNRPAGVTSLFVEGLVRPVEIGVLEHERGVEQDLRFDIEMHIEGTAAPEGDRIDAVVDYDIIDAELTRLLSGPRIELLETLCARLLDALMEPAQVIAAAVTVAKLEVLPGSAAVGCRMSRLR